MAFNKNTKGYNNFDLSKYETVKERKTRLRKDYPNSIIFPIQLSDASQSYNYVLMGALIWKDKSVFEQLEPAVLEKVAELAQKATPSNVGIIMTTIGILTKADGVGHSLSIAGGYGADKNAWVENAEESAVGRALDNMGYHSGSCSREEMEKVKHVEQAMNNRNELEQDINQMLISLTQAGVQPQYIYQIVSQSIRPFSQLNELSIHELEKLKDILQTQLDQMRNGTAAAANQ
jgi:beta-mannanase